MNSTTCPECSGPMEEGFIVDRGHYEYTKPSHWVEGRAESSFWTGTKTKGKDHYRIVTYRCERCGFLKSYAPSVEASA